MKRSILSVKFPTNQTGRVLVTDGLITRCSMNMGRWYSGSEQRFRMWCEEHKLEVVEDPCPDIEYHIRSDGTEFEEEQEEL